MSFVVFWKSNFFSERAEISLSQYCEDVNRCRGVIHEPMFLWLLTDIAYGMNFVHALGVIHRDMNLGNFLITSEFVVKVSDFGCGRVLEPDLMKSYSVKGAEFFHAPEVALGFYDQSIDVWAFGVVAYQILVKSHGISELPPLSPNMDDWFEVPASDWLQLRDSLGKIKMESFARIRRNAIDTAGETVGKTEFNRYSYKSCAPLLTKCLSVVPASRPKFDEILGELANLSNTTYTMLRPKTLDPLLTVFFSLASFLLSPSSFPLPFSFPSTTKRFLDLIVGY